MSALGRVGHVLLPTDDLDAALRFYGDVLGLPLRFRDGDRYAALDGGGTTIALAAPEEQPAVGRTAIGLKVDDVRATAERLRAAGITLLGEVEETDHELRVGFRDPDGNVFVAYASKPKNEIHT